MSELPWIEFKENSNTSGPDIAKYVSALGNSATLHDEPAGYLVWGISDDRRIVGTTFDHHTAKGKGNEDLLPWLRHSINPTPDLHFDDVTLEGKRLYSFASLLHSACHTPSMASASSAMAVTPRIYLILPIRSGTCGRN
ncbi:ATP-binding protein [Corynebacterium glucuronolyticum]|uniref:AlbA family DNA-binding domain-containing protein n=1 Tax=Corynebacterium glucuronolyticum TaxID=39791 RepID=UPI00191E499F|nr:ATP-binding protein [Corynebacterium glucuronolyticum]